MFTAESLGIVALILMGLFIGLFIFGVYANKKRLAATFEAAQKESARLMEEARKESDRIVRNAIREAKEENQNRRKRLDQEHRQKQTDIQKIEQKLKAREGALEKKLLHIEKKEKEIEKIEENLESEEAKYRGLMKQAEQTINETRHVLEATANMSSDEAKKHLLKIMEEKAREEIKEKLTNIEEEMKKEAEIKAQSIVSLAAQRVASEYVNDSTISVVSLPSEDMKGRIIGREGRNIRAIEQATGVDLIIDDTPEAVIISCFNPIRREIAKIALEKLIADGRIHPARIEETVQRVTEDFDVTIREAGEQAALDLGITDLAPDLIFQLGKLRFKVTGGHSVLQHSVETARICSIMAAELGMPQRKAKRAGLLHDIGKAVEHDVEGHHADIGANLCEKIGEDPQIVKAIRAHHSEETAELDSLSVILHAANYLSEQRPGARKDALESYIKRLDDMESLVKQNDKIDQVFVMQSGKEIRAIVTSTNARDDDIIHLANDVASRLRKEMSFPGQIRVSVTRDNKFMDFAK